MGMRFYPSALAVIALIAGAYATTSLAETSKTAGSGTVIEKLEASVNASLILLSDVENFRETLKLRQQLDPLFPGTKIAAEGLNASDDAIVDFLVNEGLITQQFPVTDTEVEQEVDPGEQPHRPGSAQEGARGSGFHV